MISLKVMLTSQRVDALKRAGVPYANPIEIEGLIDTGADGCVLDRHTIAALGLELRGRTAIHTPSTGTAYESRGVFDACFVLGESTSDALVLNLPVIESDLASEGFCALIGRNVLSQCLFTYDGPRNHFSLAWGRDRKSRR